jgi:hypothetical protein
MAGFAAWLRIGCLVRSNRSLRAPNSVPAKAAAPSRANMASI